MSVAVREVVSAAVEAKKRGYHVLYRDGGGNACPGCGRSQWHVGRTMAECAFCSTAIPMAGQ